jgi:hypothetical protein
MEVTSRMISMFSAIALSLRRTPESTGASSPVLMMFD